jgi:tryptophanyl-tRNA synthetase
MRALTGIQPSGTAHLGNLFGAMLPAIQLSRQNDQCIIFLADLHALTTVHDPKKLSDSVLDLAIDLLALGLDPEKTIFFRQSDVPAHTELAWILSTLAPMGLLQRAHSFKDKTAKGIEPTVGLFTYPVLMAADILLYDPDVVPVGKDQKQHLEIARDLAEKFNHHFGETFVLPEPQISEQTAVVPGVDGQKMSKSYGNTIEIFADEKVLKKQIMSIVTDSTDVDEPKEPEGNTIYEIYKLFASEDDCRDLADRFRAGGMGYGHAKKELLEKANSYLQPLREKREQMAADTDFVADILKEGAQKAKDIADQKLEVVKERIGL